ncbi:MAG: hypothetical protein VX910_04565 [Candidatus Latescibacterota bacterium]|nr:hypothetical protein [Candidatus Latescibacterota bacterium]
MPIILDRRFGGSKFNHKKLEKSAMCAEDRELAELYWHLQKKVHTQPKIRTYLHELTRILKDRRIRPNTLNQIGLDLAAQNRI